MLPLARGCRKSAACNLPHCNPARRPGASISAHSFAEGAVPAVRAGTPEPTTTARPRTAEWKPWEVPEGHKIPMMEEQYAEGTERASKQVPTPK